MRSKKFTPLVLLSPIVLLYCVFVIGGLFETIKESFGYIPNLNMNEIKVDRYVALFSQKKFLRNTIYSIYLALTSTVLSTLFGTMIAYFLVTTRSRWITGLVKRVLQAGLIIPYIYVVLLATIFLSQAGFVSRLLFNMGVLSDLKRFPELIFDKHGFGIIWVYIFKGTPFVALFVLNIMSKTSQTYEDVAKSLGANPFKILKKIYLPLCSKMIIWASCILFAYDLGSFEVPYLLGSVSPVSLSSKLYSLYTSPDIYKIPETMAMNVILFILGSTVVALYAMILKYVLTGRMK